MTGTVVNAKPALLPLYGRRPVVFSRGEGTRLFADDGREFLDFTSGIGVNALGYGHPVVVEAMARAAATGLIHTSNLFRTVPGETLADFLVEHSFGSSVFFCNSGAEACEAALKFARRADPSVDKCEFVAVRGSFHGRTFGALSVTDRPALQVPFQPLMSGVHFVEPGADEEQLRHVIRRDRTAAVIVEPVQGEGGVRPMSGEFLQTLRRCCDALDVPLIMDEIQCGLGRTGSLFAYEQTGVVPDILCLAKPIASGLPMGAVIVNERIAATLQPGDHATTFGGGPFVAEVALATVKAIAEPGLMESVRRRAHQIEERLKHLASDRSTIRSVRGRGLMWGIEIEGNAAEVVDRAFDHNLLLLTAGPEVVRLLPPLVVSERDIDHGLSVLADVLP